MADYRLHCFAQSGHSYKAALMLNLCGADWEPVFVDFFNGEARSEKFRELNPMGECPVLETPDIGVLTQSGVMLEYLATKFGKFQPANERDRLEVLRWVIWENQKLNGMMGPWRFMLQFAPEKIRNEAVTAFLKGRTMAAIAVLESHLAGRDWIVGDAPTTADVACAGYIFYPAEEYDFGDTAMPNITAWKERVAALPGWVHPYELMPGHPLPAAQG